VLTRPALLCPSSCILLLQRTPQETLYKIKMQEVAYPADMSEGAAAFIRAALVRDPTQCASLTDLLQHPWLRKHMRSSSGAPHMRWRTQTQSEVHCFPGGLFEARAHGGSSGSMRPALCTSSADGAHNNSCPQVLHSQLSAPAGELSAAAAREPHTLAHHAHAHAPSPLGAAQQQQQQQQAQSMQLVQRKTPAGAALAAGDAPAAAHGGGLHHHAHHHHHAADQSCYIKAAAGGAHAVYATAAAAAGAGAQLAGDAMDEDV
jgi:serine/threonine protein kinase